MAHAPQRVRWVRRYSRLGEHGAVWLALGCLGSAADTERRGRWLRATVCVGAAYLSRRRSRWRSAATGR